MFTQVVTSEGNFSLSAIAETKAAFDTHVVVILSKSPPLWVTVVRDYEQVVYDVHSCFY